MLAFQPQIHNTQTVANPNPSKATRFGAEKGNTPMVPGPGARPGNTVARFHKEMQERALKAETLQRLDAALKSAEDAIFLRAFSEVADRGFGKAPQSIQHTGAEGGPIPVLLIPPEIP